MTRSRLFFPLGQGTQQKNNAKQTNVMTSIAQSQQKIAMTFQRSSHTKKESEKFKISDAHKEKSVFEEKYKEVNFQQKSEQGKSQSFFSLYNFNVLNIVPNMFRKGLDSKRPNAQNFYSFNVFLNKCNELKQYFGKFNQKDDFNRLQSKTLKEIEDDMKTLHKDLFSVKDFHHQNTGVLEKILDNVKYLNTQTEMARKENTQQREQMRQEKIEEFDKTEHQLETAENSRHAQLEKLEKLVEKLEELIRKQDEAANSRLTLGVAYSSILSLLFAVLVFLYQNNENKEKENEQKAAAAEKARQKAEELTKKIEEIQLKYSGHTNQKVAIEKSIQKLQSSKEELIKMRDPKAKKPDTTLEVGIKQTDAKISQAQIQLEYVYSELKTLELFASSQQAIAENQKHEMDKLEEKAEEKQEESRYEPIDNRPF